ncbi:helix-turn-helix transcriptional regulator [Paenibacillus woosongensis]|uniref:Helix-turn-helix transcriptional regulator n=1 Tax=Paenibacillus woosongensis TaxID=307580 RepID=A0AA95I7B0_9BACL|nr:helix-turn-helix transcriptional regulator [Paenibacillus woosongensis]WHX50521.1 helix-turn-helix transcriptional regulator [Paenibacillus woosongensis]
MEKYSEFGAEARKIMLQRGITLKDIAEKLNVSAPYVSDILRGNRKGEKQKPIIAEMLGLESES